jgi:hypothetical protein
VQKIREFLRLAIGYSEGVLFSTRTPLGYQQISAATLAAATPLTLPPPGNGQNIGYARIQADGGTVRWRDDGVAPTAAVGMQIADGGFLDYYGDFTKFQAILSTSTPTLNVSYYAP